MEKRIRLRSRYGALLSAALLASTALPGHAQDTSALDATSVDTAADTTADATTETDSAEVQSYTYTDADGNIILLDPIVVQAASEQLKQSLGVSVISSEDLEDQPVVNDLKDAIRQMPGVNLTGSSSTGQRGNQRQIDIRGMGPENTLILIDGKPVLSRDSVKVGRSGETDTRGDSNWVPAEMVDHIEVIRGPAAARYGSGAAGGVVNIVTKKPETDLFQLSMQYNQPESSLEGNSYKGNFLWAKPLSDTLTMRLTGNYNRSNPDDPSINDSVTAEDDDAAAGVEGVVNKDVTGQLRWEPDDFNRYDLDLGFSKQDNLYAGDTLLSSGSDTTEELADEGATTNKMERATASVTHTGKYAFGDITSYIQYEHTDNTRLSEGASGGGEGRINSTTEWGTVKLDNVTAKSELNLPGSIFNRAATWTLGSELRYERMNNPVLISERGDIDISYGDTASSAADRDPVSSQTQLGLYGEGNIKVSEALTVTPTFRGDWIEDSGVTMSGGLSVTYDLNSDWTLKMGSAQAFKAPNLYQLNPNYVYYTRGNGCPIAYSGEGGCYVLGNEDLKPETSWNNEIGVSYSGPQGISATLTGFYNDYHDKIQSGMDRVALLTVDDTDYQVFQWENVPRAVVAGFEGSFNAELNEKLKLVTNFTYMAKSENKETGDPLSLVPKYTVNASLEIQATDKLKIVPSLTYYGKIEAAETNQVTGADYDDTSSREPYGLVDVAMTYEIQPKFDLHFGVTNIFDKTILRSNSGANTYNEPGRAYYFGFNKTF